MAYYSLTFKPDNSSSNNRNTWDNWGLIPDSPPFVPFPELERNLVEIPGRKNGPIDLTGVVLPKTYKRITGSWTFYKNIASRNDRTNLSETLRQFLHNKTMKVVLADDDPNHYFVGNFTVVPPKAVQNPMTVTIGYDLEPVRYNMNGTEDTSWAPA